MVTEVLTAFECQCRNCNFKFEWFDFSDFIYGRRLLHAPDGTPLAVWDCLADASMAEFSALVDGAIGPGQSARNPSAIFNSVFHVACDPIGGQTPRADVSPSCPVCDSSQISRRDYSPPKYVSMALPEVTHHHWERLDQDTKKALVLEALAKADRA